jgi:pyruvate/2-oxoglutarate dehydrogenase complex dihydrolipoamide acyltransferase (E2) component
MIFIDRFDGRRVRDLPAFNAAIPYLMRRRNESVVYFAKDIDVENAMRFVKQKNAQAGESRYSLFGILLAAAARTLALKPRMNRFIHGRAYYQRNEISISFIVKKKLTEEAAETNAKVRLRPEDSLVEAMASINAVIEKARSDEPGPDDREVEIIHRIPGGKFLFTKIFRILDRLNLAPGWMLRNDPLYTSIYFANLGSIGLDTPFHHLYEWGTASLFVVMGRMFQKDVRRPDGSVARRHFVNLKVSIDERIGEGLYFAHAAALFQRLVAHPEQLEGPTDLSFIES